MTLYEQERWFREKTIRNALLDAQGSRTVAAKALGLDVSYLRRLIRDLGITDVPPAPRKS